jgi:O-antigen/teichoic acid export membrane protein
LASGQRADRRFSSALDVLFASWIGLLASLIAFYPLDAPGSGAPRTRAILHAWEVLCVVGAWWGVWRGRARRWGRVEEALVIVAACETMCALVGPWASDPFTRWWIGRCFYLAAWSALCVVLARPARRV